MIYKDSELKISLLKLLGVDASNCTSAVIRMDIKNPISVEVTQFVLDKDGGIVIELDEAVTEFKRYELKEMGLVESEAKDTSEFD